MFPVELSPYELHALARAMLALPWEEDGLSPMARLLLRHLDLAQVDDLRALRKILGQDLLREILALDPLQQEPAPPSRTQTAQVVPALPAPAHLSEEQMAQAASVGRWLDHYVSWAGTAANETPIAFHIGAGLYLAAVAVARRLVLLSPWNQPIFPNLYLMLVAVSTYYRKSAGLSLAADLARQAIPHMLMPQPGSPENFMAMLGGVLPPNFSELSARDRSRLEQGQRFAAQRGLMRDELSGLFKSMGRDFMAGLKELIMMLYDCPVYLDSNTNNKGLVVIRDAALSILGAATPAELAFALSTSDWYNGNLARFALLTPETDYRARPHSHAMTPPGDLVQRLQHLHQRLPSPPERTLDQEHPLSEPWTLSLEAWPECLAYEQALRELTAPASALDDRLRAIYGRLHVQALKIAMLLAALDWADAGGTNKPIVTKAHWFRAQLIAEDWRASAHRLLADLSENEEARLEDRILSYLRSQPAGASLRSIYRGVSARRKLVTDALHALVEDGSVLCLPYSSVGTRGPRTSLYQIVSFERRNQLSDYPTDRSTS